MKKTMTQDEITAAKKNVRWKSAEIPIIIGVSAHRNIWPEYHEKIGDEVRSVINKIRELCPHSPIRMLTGLAAGGDMLCARIAEELGVELILALPFEENEYVNTHDFMPDEIAEYKRICNSGLVVDKFVVPDMEDVEHSDTDHDYFFRQQAIYVATNCHVMLALWDGTDATEFRTECGTNAAVGFALKQNYYQQNGMEFYPALDGAVIKIFSPRTNRTYGEIKDEDFVAKYLVPRGLVREIYEATPDGNAGSDKKYYVETKDLPKKLKQILWHTDRFNKDYLDYCESLDKPQEVKDYDYLMDEREYEHGSRRSRAVHDCYNIASKLSSINKKKNIRALMLLAVLGMLLIMSFMVYDQLEFRWTVAPCLVTIVLLILTYALAYAGERAGQGGNRRVFGKISFSVHTRFVEYRALAETLRVQYYTSLYGIVGSVCRYFTWSHKSMMPWVRKAAIALAVGEHSPIFEDKVMKDYYERQDDSPKIIKTKRTDARAVFGNKMLGKWVGYSKYAMDNNGQIGYHINNVVLKRASIRRRNLINTIALVVTLIAYFSLFICELIPGDILSTQLFWVVTARKLLKGILGLFAAITFLISYYYGKQSLDHIQADSINMVHLYRVALDRANVIYLTSDKDDVCDKAFSSLVRELAREQLIENVTWVAYNRDDNIEMPL